MIKYVRKVSEGRYIVNDAILIFDIKAEEDGFHYSLNYDEKVITENDAQLIGQEFFKLPYDNEPDE